jgi:DNA mismatch repair ATPase MutS
VCCREFKAKYDVFHEVMRKLGALDCLDSLAALAKGRPGYVRPIICDDEHRKVSAYRPYVAERSLIAHNLSVCAV